MNYWFKANRPEYVYLAAGTVGGILANSTRPAEFIYDNMLIHATVVHAAHLYGVKKLLYLGSSCIYPRDCAQPMTESQLLTGALEPTNEPYAIAKIAGIKLCQAYRRQYGSHFISAMPTNLYGPNDNFDLASAHVLPAMMRKFHEARVAGLQEVVVWGTGSPRREFLHVDDLADACVLLMEKYDEEEHVNVGTGEDVSIRELTGMLREIVHPEATLRFDPDEAGRHATQAARRLAPASPRLAPPHRLARRDRVDVPVVRGEPGKLAPVGASNPSSLIADPGSLIPDPESLIADPESSSRIQNPWSCIPVRTPQNPQNSRTLRTKKRPGPFRNPAPLLPNELGSYYQFTRTPKRMTRGATIAWIWLALVAFCRLRIAWIVFEFARLKMSSDGTKLTPAKPHRALDVEVEVVEVRQPGFADRVQEHVNLSAAVQAGGGLDRDLLRIALARVVERRNVDAPGRLIHAAQLEQPLGVHVDVADTAAGGQVVGTDSRCARSRLVGSSVIAAAAVLGWLPGKLP